MSPELGGDDIARICIDCKADIIMVQNEQILKKVIYILPAVHSVIRHILVLIYSLLGLACYTAAQLLSFQILLIHHKLPQLRTIVQYTGLPPLSDQRRLHKSHGKHILSWEELAEIGKILTENKLGKISRHEVRDIFKWCLVVAEGVQCRNISLKRSFFKGSYHL